MKYFFGFWLLSSCKCSRSRTKVKLLFPVHTGISTGSVCDLLYQMDFQGYKPFLWWCQTAHLLRNALNCCFIKYNCTCELGHKDAQMHGSLLDELYLHKDSVSFYLCFTNLHTSVLFIILHPMDPSQTRCARYLSDMKTFTRQEEGIHSWNCETYEIKNI